MSRVHYKNDTIRKAFGALDELEQSMGWNMRCAYPGDYQPGDDFHDGAMKSLAQTLSHLPTIRRLLDEVEAEIIKVWVDAPAEEKKYKAEEEAKAAARKAEAAAREEAIIFKDGSTLASVRKMMAEEGFMVVPDRLDRRLALGEVPF